MQPAGQKSVFDVSDVVLIIILLLTLKILSHLKHARLHTSGASFLTAAYSRLQLRHFQQEI